MRGEELRGAVERFGEYLATERRLSPRTVAAYSRELTVGMTCLLRDEKTGCEEETAGPGTADVAAIVARPKLGGGRASPKTQNHRLSIWREFCRYAAERERWPTNPTAGIPWAKVPRDARLKAVVDRKGIDLLVAAARGQANPAFAARDAAVIGLLYHSGLRLSELVGLDVANVAGIGGGENGGRPPVLLSVLRKGGIFQDLPLNTEAAGLSARWLRERDGLGLDTAERALLVSRQRRRITGRAVEQLVARLGERAGLGQRVTPHLLRHSFATALLASGAAYPTAQRLLNHSRVETTAIYAHPGEAEARDAVERLVGRTPTEPDENGD